MQTLNKHSCTDFELFKPSMFKILEKEDFKQDKILYCAKTVHVELI